MLSAYNPDSAQGRSGQLWAKLAPLGFEGVELMVLVLSLAQISFTTTSRYGWR